MLSYKCLDLQALEEDEILMLGLLHMTKLSLLRVHQSHLLMNNHLLS